MSTPTPVAPATTAKVFNQGGRIFEHHELRILPGKFTPIPEKYLEAVEKMLRDYPTELITAESSEALGKGAAVKMLELQAENTKLKGQVEKLQTVLLQDDKAIAEKLDKTTADLKVAQENMRAASERISSLEGQLMRANADIERLTAPAKKT